MGRWFPSFPYLFVPFLAFCPISLALCSPRPHAPTANCTDGAQFPRSTSSRPRPFHCHGIGETANAIDMDRTALPRRSISPRDLVLTLFSSSVHSRFNMWMRPFVEENRRINAYHEWNTPPAYGLDEG